MPAWQAIPATQTQNLDPNARRDFPWGVPPISGQAVRGTGITFPTGPLPATFGLNEGMPVRNSIP